MTTFITPEGYLNTELLATLHRGRKAGLPQVYPLDPHPYGYKPEKRIPDNPRSYMQVKARPNDPASPFIWGIYALMMVCGGYYHPQDAPPDVMKPRTVPRDEYDGRRVYRCPQPRLSDATTTNKLLAVMLNAGFTWEEALATLERHPAAGGAYLYWITKFPDDGEKPLADWRDTKHHESLTPVSISPSSNPWKGIDPISPLLDIPAMSSKGEIETPHHTHKGTGESMDIKRETVREILRAIEREKDNPAYLDGEGLPLSTVKTLKASPIVKLNGRKESWLSDLYLPFLVAEGVLIETTDVHKAQPGKGRAPARGYSLAPAYATPEALEAWYLARWPQPAQEAAEEPPEASAVREWPLLTVADLLAATRPQEPEGQRPATLAEIQAAFARG